MLSIPHLIVIFIVALVVFGPEKLPELARTLGKVMAEFRRHTGDLRSTFEGHLRDLEREADARRIASPSSQSVPYPSAEPQAAPSEPGTVPSNPPNAAAIATKVADHSPETLVDSHPDLPNLDVPIEPPVATSAEPEAHKSGQNPEQVSDGSVHPS